ncbi:MAG: hypothetical protein GTO63_14730, partial [Anaerolineae bacterium]|nr:hypothetical protein [Anaerolineae bacterium]NIN96099.1 hypothetical protein [Anaerolineae bacterium]
MPQKIFLASYDYGLSRAEYKPGRTWKVEHLVKDLQVSCLAADPSDPQVAYAGSRNRGIWLSSDCGRTWTASGLDNQIVKSLAVSPHDPNTIYAGTKPALMFKSTDGGRTWRELENFRRIPGRWWWLSPAEPPDIRPY